MTMRTRYLAAAVTLVFTFPHAARAQAFGVNEIGTCAASRGFAVTGAPCQDASSIFWNPGLVPAQSGWHLLGGLAVISVSGTFTQDTTFREWDSDAESEYVPHVFLQYRGANSALAYGVGVYVPYGLTSQWTDSFPGRFQALKASIATIYVQPNVSWQFHEKWSIGAGPVFGHSSVELIQALDLSEQVVGANTTFAELGISQRTEFARATLDGSANAFGGHIGFFGRPNEDWSVGVRFLTPLEFEYDDADATFTQTQTDIILPAGNPICSQQPALCGGNPAATLDVDAFLQGQFSGTGTLASQGVRTKITHPAQIQGGVGFSGIQNWLLSVDYAWTGWRRFKELPVEFQGAASGSNRVLIEDYNNTSAIRLGAQRAFTNGAQLRLGFSGVASAAPDETVTPLLPEQDRGYASIGGAYPVTSNIAVEGAYLRVFSGGKRGRISERTSRTQTAAQLNTGVFDLHANVFSLSMKATF